MKAICCVGNLGQKSMYEIFETVEIPQLYYQLKTDWQMSIVKQTLNINYGACSQTETTACMNRIKMELRDNELSVAEQVYEIFSIMDGKYPAISTNLDWKEWKEHLQKWFREKKIDEYYYEPIAACSVFSLELDVNVYADMVGLPRELSSKIIYMIRDHIEPIRYNRVTNTIQPKHDIAANVFFYTHPKSDPIYVLISYLEITGCRQEIFDYVLRKGNIYKKRILPQRKKLDYKPLLDYIERNRFHSENKSRFVLAKLWNYSSLEDQLIYIHHARLVDYLDEFIDNEKEKLYTEVGIILRKARRYQEAEEVFIKGLEKENIASYNELGRLYVEQKRYEEAEHIFLEGLKYELNEYFLVSLVELYQRMGASQKIDILMKNYTNKKTVYFSKYCKKCYRYLLNAKGLKEALKYKNRLLQLNNKMRF